MRKFLIISVVLLFASAGKKSEEIPENPPAEAPAASAAAQASPAAARSAAP